MDLNKYYNREIVIGEKYFIGSIDEAQSFINKYEEKYNKQLLWSDKAAATAKSIIECISIFGIFTDEPILFSINNDETLFVPTEDIRGDQL